MDRIYFLAQLGASFAVGFFLITWQIWLLAKLLSKFGGSVYNGHMYGFYFCAAMLVVGLLQCLAGQNPIPETLVVFFGIGLVAYYRLSMARKLANEQPNIEGP